MIFLVSSQDNLVRNEFYEGFFVQEGIGAFDWDHTRPGVP